MEEFKEQSVHSDLAQTSDASMVEEYLYEHNYSILDKVRQQSYQGGFYDERSEDNQFKIEDKSLKFHKYYIGQLFTSQLDLQKFWQHFHYLNLLRLLKIEGMQSIKLLAKSPNFLWLGTKNYLFNFSEYLCMGYSMSEKLRMISKVAKTVEQLHFNNIAHRDIKSDNILINIFPDIEIELAYSKTLAFNHETQTLLSPEKTVYYNQKARWPVTSFNHDSWALGVLILEAIKGVTFFRRSFNSTSKIIQEANRINEDDNANPILKELLAGTLTDQDQVLTAKQICERLELLLQL